MTRRNKSLSLSKVLLGPKSKSPAGVAGASEVWSSIRDGLIWALAFAGVAFLEQIDAVDFGPTWDGLIAAVVATAVQFIRRWMKDYSPEPTFPPET